MNLQSYITDFVTSKDGTIIGYRQLGQGPSLILVHGGIMASQNFMKLATALSNEFTVYVPDRRGRGLSGPHGDNYCLTRECEDMQALIKKTGTQNIFGLSSGAIVSLQAALETSIIRKVALYEPPIPVMSNSSSLTNWVPRFNRELAQGKLGSAFVSILKGTGDSSLFSKLPRYILVPLMTFAIKTEGKEAKTDNVPLKVLIPTMKYDTQLVNEMEGKLQNIMALEAKVLLLGGSKSQAFLKSALDELSSALPHAKRIEFPRVGHLAAENNGKPEYVAEELRQFFSE
ncbi:Pimeloyl-ACP methyl ester carboxylesterase [Paenibacillus sp. yr247]|uniref:alpha/beta fold hydrolase n=1 Tax=Paenibacillus sp. yr247 TaxID=1761880 RepID=UPI0008835B91|nr:alpha/beta hydrolase [Paenibacillus sp. yr247]SDN66733.1 Pimeloyl-ACP methyl ester carboxylesterase [Paenibacillus sp. yr247]